MMFFFPEHRAADVRTTFPASEFEGVDKLDAEFYVMLKFKLMLNFELNVDFELAVEVNFVELNLMLNLDVMLKLNLEIELKIETISLRIEVEYRTTF